jgi:hypothetical protein
MLFEAPMMEGELRMLKFYEDLPVVEAKGSWRGPVGPSHRPIQKIGGPRLLPASDERIIAFSDAADEVIACATAVCIALSKPLWIFLVPPLRHPMHTIFKPFKGDTYHEI